MEYQSFCAVDDLGPPNPFPVRNGSPPIYVFLLSLGIVRQLSLAGEGAGGPKSYDCTETLVLCTQYSLYGGDSLNVYTLYSTSQYYEQTELKTQQNGDNKIQKLKQKYEDLQVRGEQADGVRMPEPGQLELDMADGCLQMLVQGHREPA